MWRCARYFHYIQNALLKGRKRFLWFIRLLASAIQHEYPREYVHPELNADQTNQCSLVKFVVEKTFTESFVEIALASGYLRQFVQLTISSRYFCSFIVSTAARGGDNLLRRKGRAMIVSPIEDTTAGFLLREVDKMTWLS